MPKKFLILYAKSGSLGHKIIADNYGNILRDLGHEVLVKDIYETERKFQINLGNRLYFILITRLSWLWRLLYRYWSVLPGIEWARTSLFPRRLRRTQRLILEFGADTVITTHPAATSVANYLKVQGQLSADLVTVFSDWHVQSFWIFPKVDGYLVATEEQRDDLIARGFKYDQVTVTGILLGESFYNAPTREEARRALGLPSDGMIVLVMGGGQGWNLEKLIQSLNHMRSVAHVIVLCGNAKRKIEIEAFIKARRIRLRRCTAIDFVDPVTYFAAADLLITKPGGLTTAEAFQMRLPVLAYSPVPGQEDENVRVLIRSNAILLSRRNASLGSLVDDLLSNQQRLNDTAMAAFQLLPSKAHQNICSLWTSSTS
jgi:processive 1,2-diacylglycerol beta-glucosyltransferase